MILKNHFHPINVFKYIKRIFLFSLIWNCFLCSIRIIVEPAVFSLNFTLIAILGSSLAIFIAFTNNAAFSRWWDARNSWSALTSYSREFGRMISNFSEVGLRKMPEREEEILLFKKQLIYNQIAFVHSLKNFLRKIDDGVLKKYNDEIYDEEVNVPYQINHKNGSDIRLGQDNGLLEWFHTFQIEANLTQFSNILANCEKIKETPLPKQYTFFTKVFLVVFIVLLPFGIFSFYPISNLLNQLIAFSISLLISTVFIVMEKTGRVVENPFENTITDIPMTSISNTIERDLLQLLDGEGYPDKVLENDGYLH